MKRRLHRPTGADRGDFGAAEARVGIALLLGLPLDMPAPTRDANRIPMDDRTPAGGAMDPQCSTQRDGLGHCGGAFDADGDGVAWHVFHDGDRSDTDLVRPVAACRWMCGRPAAGRTG